MSSEYYTLEDAAKVLKLPTAEVNRLREKNSLRAFRDGASWKFKKSDVDNHLASIIKSRGAANPAGDSDFDLLNTDDDADEAPTLLSSKSFDVLMEDGGGLSLAEEHLVSATPQGKDQDDGFGDLIIADDDDFSLSDDSSVVPAPLAKKPAESSVKVASSSDVDLAVVDDSVFSSGSSVNLAGDSGISLLEGGSSGDVVTPKLGSDLDIQFDDDSDILSLADSDVPIEHTRTISIPVEDDFQLTPDSKIGPVDESESGSQVIALDESGSGSQVIALEEDSPFGTGAGTPFAAAAEPLAGVGFGDTANSYSAPAGDFLAAASPLTSAPAKPEVSYSPMLVTALVLIAVFLVLPGMMVMDLIIHIWSWGEPFVINSSVMDLVAGMAGLK